MQRIVTIDLDEIRLDDRGVSAMLNRVACRSGDWRIVGAGLVGDCLLVNFERVTRDDPPPVYRVALLGAESPAPDAVAAAWRMRYDAGFQVLSTFVDDGEVFALLASAPKLADGAGEPGAEMSSVGFKEN